MSIRSFLVFTLLFLLCNCAQVPQDRPLNLSWHDRQQQLSMITSWQFRGDVIFKDQEHKQEANIFWQQKSKQYHLIFFGPFGIGAISLTGNQQHAELKDGKGQHYSAENPEKLMQKMLGWSIPISSFTYWVRGLHAPTSITAIHYDAYHRIDHLRQEGWDIQFVRYTQINTLELPQKIIFTRNDFYLELTIENNSWVI